MNWQDEMVECFRSNLENRLRRVIRTKLFVNYFPETECIRIVIKDEENMDWVYKDVINKMVSGDMNTRDICKTVCTEYKAAIIQRAVDRAFWNTEVKSIK